MWSAAVSCAAADHKNLLDNREMTQVNIDFKQVIQLVRDTKPLILNDEQAHQVTVKGLADYVTQVDYAVQNHLVQALAEAYPEVQFLGEEGQKTQLDWQKPVWILDPVDGTTNLIHDFKSSCVALGLWDGRSMVFGCVYNPFREELFTAVSGQGAYLNGTPIAVSRRPTLSKSLIMVGTSPYEKDRADEVFGQIKRVYLASEDIRRSGSAALDICTVACGRADGFFEYNLKPWDYAAASVILAEAGGGFSCIDGAPVFPGKNADVVGSNGSIHAELLDTLR